MNYQKGKIGLVVLLTLATLASTGVGQSATTIDVRELAPVAESFRQLAMWDAATAGDLWMNEQAVDTWERFINVALPNQTAMISLFSYNILLGDIADDGTPLTGLFNPWTSTLIVLAFSENAALVTAVAVESVTRTFTENTDVNQAALELMEVIGLAGDRFDEYVMQPWQSVAAEDDWQDIADRLVTQSAQLRLVYPAENIVDPALALAQEIIALIQLVDLTGLLSVLKDADPTWTQSLLPTYAASTDNGVTCMLGSSVEPLDLVWLRISDEGLQEISWIRLFDRVITLTEGES